MYNFYVNVAPNTIELANIDFFKNFNNNIVDLKLKSKDFFSFDDCEKSVNEFLNHILLQLNTNREKLFFIERIKNPLFVYIFDSLSDHIITEVGELSKWGNNELMRFYLLNENENAGTNANGDVNYLTHLVVSISYFKPENQKGN